MPTKVISEPGHVEALAILLRGRKLPLTVSWVQGASRRQAQNRLAFQWYGDISRQLGDQTIGQVRSECKCRFAAPILCADHASFAVTWGRLRERFTWEEVLAFVEATELPMSSLLTVKQMTEYLDAINLEYSRQGVRLTDPEALKYQEESR